MFNFFKIAHTFTQKIGLNWDNLLLVLVIGSANKSINSARDIDLFIVNGNGYKRLFEIKSLDNFEIEAEIVGADAFRSYKDNYYWYPDHLVAEIGKFARGTVIKNLNTCKINDTLQTIIEPPKHVRQFIITFHLGRLYKAIEVKNQETKDLYYGTYVEWSILSCLAALWNIYPLSMTRNSFLEALCQNKQQIAKYWLYNNSICTRNDLNMFVDWIAENLAKNHLLDNNSQKEAWPTYYPQNKKGFIMLKKRIDEIPERTMFSPR